MSARLTTRLSCVAEHGRAARKQASPRGVDRNGSTSLCFGEACLADVDGAGGDDDKAAPPRRRERYGCCRGGES